MLGLQGLLLGRHCSDRLVLHLEFSMLAFTGWAGLAFKAATAALKRAASSALCFFLCIHGAMQGKQASKQAIILETPQLT